MKDLSKLNDRRMCVCTEIEKVYIKNNSIIYVYVCIYRDIPEKQMSKPTITLREDGLYDILSRVELLDEELQETAANLECILDIPKANYSVSRKIVYYPG